jgi:ketosteroid isomerase-like protein
LGNETKNVEKLKAAYKSWHETKGGSVDQWMSFMADDVKFGSLAGGAPHVPFTTTYTSKQALKAYFAGLLAGWEMLHYTADEYIAQGESVVMRGSTAWRSKLTGKVCSTPKLDYWCFRDGKAVEYFEYFDTAGLQAAAAP